MIRGGCLATSYKKQENAYIKQENDEQKNNVKYFSIVYFPKYKY